MVRFIISNRFLRYSSFWWWVRLMSHEGFRFDDYHIWSSFWSSLNRGYLDMNYKWEFEKFWGKGSYPPETIVLPAEDFDALAERLNNPNPEQIKSLKKLLNRHSPWDEDT